MQETFSRLLLCAEQAIDDEVRWLWGIARNVCLEHWRNSKPPIERSDEGSHEDLGAPGDLTVPELIANNEWQTRIVARALKDARLKETHLVVMLLCDREGLSYAEIAERCSITPNQVKKMLRKARPRLKDFVKRHLERDLR
jgi:RNA polymerase sigma factor (sigma-70 family)